MRAVDTNLIVRYIVANDDPAQSKIAKSLIDNEDVFIPTTVFLETEWVLRSIYKFAKGDIVLALGGFAGLPTVFVEGSAQLIKAFAWMDDGLDFADALHVASAYQSEEFVTFDKALVKSAKTVAKPRVALA